MPRRIPDVCALMKDTVATVDRSRVERIGEKLTQLWMGGNRSVFKFRTAKLLSPSVEEIKIGDLPEQTGMNS
jgi:hypothetical protein